MKKLILMLAVLVAAPAFALNVGFSDQGGGVLDIVYSDADPCNLPRAFALDITVTDGGFIADVNNYKLDGESTQASPGFGIYPARIVIDANGNVTSYGSPLADPCDPGAGTGIGSNHVVLEFGSLYDGDINAPDVNGTLCRIVVDCNGASDVNVVMVDEDTYRGGLVLEDGTQGDVSAEVEVVCAVDPNAGTCWDPLECAGQPSGDATCDGAVNFADLVALKQSFFKSKGQVGYNCCADFDHSNTVNFADLVIIKQNFFSSGYAPSTGEQSCPQ